MATLKELIDKHRNQVPGLKVRHLNWPAHGWMEIIQVRGPACVGWYEDGTGAHCDLMSQVPEWELYQPPAPKKRKVTMYPALCKDSDGDYWVPDFLYETEEKARHDQIAHFVRLLTDRGVEIEVGE